MTMARVGGDQARTIRSIFIPGVGGHYSDFIEHPRALVDRLARYTRIVGRENVIAGANSAGPSFRR
jgi:5-methyltetrahydropteroyltriglutamate--homocysteine methyltransferase